MNPKVRHFRTGMPTFIKGRRVKSMQYKAWRDRCPVSSPYFSAKMGEYSGLVRLWKYGLLASIMLIVRYKER